MDASIWNGKFKTLGVFHYYQQNNTPHLPPYILLLNKDAISRDGADPAEVFAASVKSARVACANQFPELKTDKYKSEFGWLRWTQRIDFDTFASNATLGNLHAKSDIAGSTIVLKHLIQSSLAEDLKNTLLAQVTTLQDPTAKRTAHVPQQKMRVAPASALRSRKSTQPKRPPQRLQTSTPTTRARSSSRSKRVTKPKGLTTGSKRPRRSLKSTTLIVLSDSESDANLTPEVKSKKPRARVATPLNEADTPKTRELKQLRLALKAQQSEDTPKTAEIKRLRAELNTTRNETPTAKALREANEKVQLLQQQLSAQQQPQQQLPQASVQQLFQAAALAQTQRHFHQIQMLMAMAAGSPGFAQGYLIGK